MGGLKKMIRARIPSPWLHVLAKERKIGMYVDLVYKTHCGLQKYNKEYLPSKIARLKDALKETNPIGTSNCFFISANFLQATSNKEYQMWREISSKIQNYKESCR